MHADPEAIAAAYRDKARRHHPDVSSAPDAERTMAEINAAWTTLRDPDRRAAWDRANLRIQQPAPAPYDPRAAPSRRARPHRPAPRSPRTPGAPRTARLASRPQRRGRGGTAARPRAGACCRSAAHRLVAGRDRAGGPGLSRLAEGPPRGRPVPQRDRALAGGAELDAGRPRAGTRPQARPVPLTAVSRHRARRRTPRSGRARPPAPA